MKLNVNKDLLPMKGHYFLFNAGVAPVQPFMPVIAKDLNFSNAAVGIINAILPFTGMLAKPLFGALADRFRLHKCDLSTELRTELCGSWKADPKICTENIASDVVYTHFPQKEGPGRTHSDNRSRSALLDDVKLEFVASVPMKHTLKVADCLYFRVADAQLNDETHHIPYCFHEADTHCKIHCEDSKLAELLSEAQETAEPDDDFVHHHQFWLFLFLAIVSWVGMAVVTSIADAVCFEMLGENASNYGFQRLWGSIGWGTFAIVSGLIVDRFSTGGRTNYTPAFYLMLVLIICDVVCSYSLKYEQTKASYHLLRNVTNLLKDVWIDVFLVWCIVLGMCVGVQWTFLFLHLEKLMNCDQRSSQKTLLGLVSGVQCFLGELPSFFIFGWLVKKIGHIHLMTLIAFLTGIRFILYSVIPDPWWVLPVELFQSALGLSFATMASYASVVAPPGAEATVQGLVGAIFEGIGISLGSYLGGVVFEAYGGRSLFQIFASLAFALCLTHGTVHYILGKNSKLQTQGKESGEDGMTSDSSVETTTT